MTDIVTVPTGNFTPGALATLQNTAALINASWNQANLKVSSFEAKMTGVNSWLPNVTPSNVVAGVASTPAVAEPLVNIPASASTTDIMSAFDTKYMELVALLANKFVDFRSTYFADDTAAYTQAQAWLTAAINNPTQALPATVAAQLITDAKDRLVEEATRASEATLQTFAARRFPLPPGAAAAAVLEIQQNAQDATAESIRKVTTVSIEQIKFALEKSIDLRKLAMNAAIEYIKALASGPEMASRVIGIGYDAQSKLISAASQFYNARTDAAKLVAESNQFNVKTALEAAEKNQTKDVALVEDKLKALIAEAQSLAQMATALFNNLHTSAGTGYSVSVQESTAL